MIRFRDESARPASPAAAKPWPAPILHMRDPLSGPGRAPDPVDAMHQDVTDIVGGRGCVEETDLVQRGWTAAEIVEHLPDALRRDRGMPDRVRP